MAAAKECLGIVGVGMIGGSIGLAARRAGLFETVIGVDHDPDLVQDAWDVGCLNEATTSLPAAAKRADVLVFCTPVDQIARLALAAAADCRPGTLLTDAGSTKTKIVAEIAQSLPRHVDFVGAHPLAGSEKCGPGHARADLFDGRLAILTPTELTSPKATELAHEFWSSLGCRVWTMSPEQHDAALALTSHLPHLVSAALAGVLPTSHLDLTGTGFRDVTRLASGEPELWAAIFAQNAANLITALDRFGARMDQFRAALLAGDLATIEQLLLEAKKVRDDLGN